MSQSPQKHPHLQLAGLEVRYPCQEGEVCVINQLNLQLQRGEIGWLLGSSGCGKTTILRAIAGFEPLHAGEIRLDGRLLSSTQQSVVPEKRNVGMMFQDYALFPHLTVAKNVGFGLGGLERGARNRRIAEMLELVGLADLAKRYPHELSGGQQQ